jgi:hypothetical protein
LQERRRLRSLSGSGNCSRAVSSSTTHRRGPRPGPWILAQGRPEREESRDDDFLGENTGIGEIVGFEAFVSEPEDIEAGFVSATLLLLFSLVAATRLEDTKRREEA